MKNIIIKLPKELHGSYKNQTPISFELSARHHIINGVQYNNSEELHHLIHTPYFKGYLFNVLKKSIMVTVFVDNDVLQGL